MSGRLQPDRPGYTGYSCNGSIPVYETVCMCCRDASSPGCSEEYLNIPPRSSLSTVSIPWNPDCTAYLLRGDKVPGTNRYNWITADGVTPPTCGDTMEPAYDYLETEYIDVPPIATRGFGVVYSSPPPPAGPEDTSCPACYEIKYSDDTHEVEKVYYLDNTGNEIEATADADGVYQPKSVHRTRADSSYWCRVDPEDENSQPTEAVEILFSICPPLIGEYRDKTCSDSGADGVKYIEMVPSSNGKEKNIKFAYDNISGYSSSGKYGLIIEDGCLKWLQMDECP